jgi:hypothetical protein
MDEVLELIVACRYLAAKEKWDAIEAQYAAGTLPARDVELMTDRRADIDQLLERVVDIEDGLLAGRDDPDESWILGLTYLGITTRYKIADDGFISVRMEGVLDDLPIFEQCAVIHEVDLFKEWVPFCNASSLVEKKGYAELAVYVSMYFPILPPISRDVLIHAYGADCLHEHGKILILGKSTEEWPGKEIPFKPTGWLHDKVDIKEFKALIHVLSPQSAKTVIITRIHPRMILPQFVINFLIRNLAGIFLYLFQQKVIKVSKDPSCPHGRRIVEDKKFYRDWLFRKLEVYCKLKGWETPTVAALAELMASEETDQEISLGEAALDKIEA